jgi:hypothetical protein
VRNGPVLFGNQSFRQVTPFVEVDAGRTTSMCAPPAPATNALALSNIRLDAGKMYTVVAAGRVRSQPDASGNARNPLRAEILINYYVYP